MAGLLSGVLPAVYSAGDRAKRLAKQLLSDPIGYAAQTAGAIQDEARQQEQLMGQAFSNPQRPLQVTNPQALSQASNRMMTGLMGFAPVGMTKAPWYGGEHRPMTIESGAATLDDLTRSFPEDIYGPNAYQYYGSGLPGEKKILQIMQSLKGKPDEFVTIYRGVPKGVTAIEKGDWVTLLPEYAQEYGNVISKKVPASHVTSWPDSLAEFGYFPK